MKKFLILIYLFILPIIGYNQKISVKTEFVKNFLCFEVDIDTNGFGYVVHGSFEWTNISKNYLDVEIDIQNKTMIKSYVEYDQNITKYFKIDSINLVGDTINFSYLDFDKEKNKYFTSYVSMTTDKDGDYPVFINYYFFDEKVFGYLMTTKSCQIDIK